MLKEYNSLSEILIISSTKMAFETNKKKLCVFFRTQHAWIKNVLSKGTQLSQRFFFFFLIRGGGGMIQLPFLAGYHRPASGVQMMIQH